MKERQELNFFDSLSNYHKKQEINRQSAYENKICKKLITKFFDEGSPELDVWRERLEASSEPLAELQDLFGQFWITTHRLQRWSINDFLKSPTKLERHPLWKEFAKKVAVCQKGQIPAMVFYNSVINQDMVIHTGISTRMPNGYLRLVRSSSSGDGGVVIDTLEGFLKTIAGNK